MIEILIWTFFLFQNRGKNSSNDAASKYSNSSGQSNNSSTPLWKNNSNQSTQHSYLTLGNQRTNKHDDCEASTSWSAKESSIKYRSSISDLGGSGSALAQITNTRIKSITKRRGAVKYQKYKNDFFLFSFVLID